MHVCTVCFFVHALTCVTNKLSAKNSQCECSVDSVLNLQVGKLCSEVYTLCQFKIWVKLSSNIVQTSFYWAVRVGTSRNSFGCVQYEFQVSECFFLPWCNGTGLSVATFHIRSLLHMLIVPMSHKHLK